jgi:hypothetical protein
VVEDVNVKSEVHNEIPKPWGSIDNEKNLVKTTTSSEGTRSEKKFIQD